MATLDKGTPIGVTDLTASAVLDKGTPIGVKEDSSENTDPAQEGSDEAVKDSE